MPHGVFCRFLPVTRPRVRLARTALGLGAFSVAAFGQISSDPTFPRTSDPIFSIPPRFTERLPVFFPPNPPPLGRAVPRTTSPSGRFTAPAELAAYVNEPFYPQLGSRLHTRSLSEKHRTQLNQYLATKRALQAELRKELERVRDRDGPTRAQELAAFSRRQTPKIIELETTAEQIRRDLHHGDHAWSALREWRLSDNPQRGYSPLEIAQVMRSYAFYHNGLVPAQRRLLREIALELQMAAESTEKATAAQPHLFFPPEPARVLLPDNAPAAVAAKMAAYQTKKSQLKKELYDAIYSHDGERFGFLSGTLKKLVDKQTSRLAELEKLAEEIREGLAEVPEPAQVSERTPLPPLLHARVAAVVQQLTEAQKQATAKLQAIIARSRDLPLQTSYRFDSEGLKYVVVPSGRRGAGRPISEEERQRIESIRAEFATVAEEFGRRLADMMNERTAITAEIEQLLGTNKTETVNNAFATAVRVATAKESETAYREYRIAVFQPGLSPEQRRLLFDSVIEQLELPLPRGELQPVQRASSW